MSLLSRPLRRWLPLMLVLTVACEKDPAAPGGLTNYKKAVILANDSAAPYDVTELTDGSLFVLGRAFPTNSTSPQEKVLGLKLTAAGDTVWSRRYAFGPLDGLVGYGTASTCLPTTDGNVVISGQAAAGAGSGQYESFVVKLSAATGAVLWKTAIPSNISSGVSKIVSLPDGGFLLLNKLPQGPALNFNLHRLSATGALVSSTTHPGDVAGDIQPTADGNFIVTGVNEPYSRNQVYMVKVTPLGAELWRQTPGADHFGVVNSVVQTADGGYAVVSGQQYFATNNIQLLRTDATGRQLAVTPVSTNLQGWIDEVLTGPDNSLLMRGYQSTGASSGNSFFLRTSASGAEQLRKSNAAPSGIATAFCKTKLGNLILCSTTAGKLEVQRTNPDMTD